MLFINKKEFLFKLINFYKYAQLLALVEIMFTMI